MAAFTIVFSNPSGPTHTLGPLQQIHLRARSHELRELLDGPVLATESKFGWSIKGGKYSRFDCETGCYVTLEGGKGKLASQRYGPFRSFSSLNGLKYVDHQLFCIYDESVEDWYGYESGQHWDTLLVTPA
ncbi:MAG TPA: hypothetical protein VNH12_05850 [Burkholderiales bacterium]|nr:hypothetical protein [Burkholderiales bacterium]